MTTTIGEYGDDDNNDDNDGVMIMGGRKEILKPTNITFRHSGFTHYKNENKSAS